MKIARIFEVIKNILPSRGGGNNSLKSNSYTFDFYSRLRDISLKSGSVFPNFLRKHHSGIVLIEVAVTLPVVMYIMLFCLELVKIHLLQISIDKICAECVYHMCSERTALSFETIFRKYTPSYMPIGYMRYWVRIYTSLDKMMSETPYGGERIVFPNIRISNDDCLNADVAVGIGANGDFIPHRRYGTGDWLYNSISSSVTPALMRNGIPKGYAFVVTVVARHKFSSAFIEKLFSGGSNTNKAGYYILWSREVGIVN